MLWFRDTPVCSGTTSATLETNTVAAPPDIADIFTRKHLIGLRFESCGRHKRNKSSDRY